MTPKKPEVMADARFEHPRNGEGSRFHGDMTIVRSTHGITAVRQRVCVSNDIAVHALEVDVDLQSARLLSLPAAAPASALRRHGGSAIVINGSMASSKGMPAFSVYATSKAALRSFARGWSVELKDRDIRV